MEMNQEALSAIIRKLDRLTGMISKDKLGTETEPEGPEGYIEGQEIGEDQEAGDALPLMGEETPAEEMAEEAIESPAMEQHGEEAAEGEEDPKKSGMSKLEMIFAKSKK